MTVAPTEVSALIVRVQRDFLNTPQLALTMPQAERHFGLDQPICEAAIHALVEARVLFRGRDGAYRRFFPRLSHAA